AHAERDRRHPSSANRDFAVQDHVERIAGVAGTHDRGAVVEPCNAAGPGHLAQMPTAQSREERNAGQHVGPARGIAGVTHVRRPYSMQALRTQPAFWTALPRAARVSGPTTPSAASFDEV